MRSVMKKWKMGRDCGYTTDDRLAIARLRGWLATVLAVFLGMVAVNASSGRHGNTRLAVVEAIVSGLGFAGIVVLSWMVVLRSGDEYRRALLSKALTWGVGATVALTSIWGYVETAWPAAPRLPMLAVPTVLIFVTTAAKVLVFRRELATKDAAIG